MVALDIFIGLVLIYFLYALLISIITEMCSTWIGMRARMLRQGIDNLLNDKHPGLDNRKDFLTWIKDAFLVEAKEFRYTQAGRFFQEPTIKYLAKVGENKTYSNRYTKPSYISKENFTNTILNMLGQKNPGINEWEKIKFAIEHNTLALEPDTLKMFSGWLLRSNDSYQQFIANIGRTYTDMMDRVNGWYKRKISLFIFWFGFLICMIMNVDSIEIVKILADDPAKRQEMVKLAIATIEAEDKFINDTGANRSIVVSDTAQYQKLKERYDTTMSSIAKSQLLMANGWVYPTDSAFVEKENKTWQKTKFILSQSLPWKMKFWGLVITALALSLGAQFWFDLLKKLVALRGAGVKPEERPNDPMSVLQPASGHMNDGLARNTRDLVKIGIGENRAYWESLPGFVAINEEFDNQNKKYIKLTFESGSEPFQTATIYVDGETVKVDCIPGEKGKMQNNAATIVHGMINQSSTRSWGTPSGIVVNPRLNRYAVLTCGHVIRSEFSSFIDPKKSTIRIKNTITNTEIELGKAQYLVMSGYCDAGIIDTPLDPAILERDFSIRKLDTYRKVSHTENRKTEVVIRSHRKPIEGLIIRANEFYSFDDQAEKDIRYLDLIRIGRRLNDPEMGKPLTTEGDSGALIVDHNNIPIAILVGASRDRDGEFSYGIKLNDIFEILQIQKYSPL